MNDFDGADKQQRLQRQDGKLFALQIIVFACFFNFDSAPTVTPLVFLSFTQLTESTMQIIFEAKPSDAKPLTQAKRPRRQSMKALAIASHGE